MTQNRLLLVSTYSASAYSVGRCLLPAFLIHWCHPSNCQCNFLPLVYSVELLRRDRRLTELIQRKKGALPAIFKYQTRRLQEAFACWKTHSTQYSTGISFHILIAFVQSQVEHLNETGHHNSLAGSVHLAFDHWRSEASRLGPGSENP